MTSTDPLRVKVNSGYQHDVISTAVDLDEIPGVELKATVALVELGSVELLRAGVHHCIELERQAAARERRRAMTNAEHSVLRNIERATEARERLDRGGKAPRR